jgi:beta-lactamase class A
MKKSIKLIALVGLIALCFGAGYFVRIAIEERAPHHKQIRLGGYQFISPLLECEVSHSSSNSHPDLGPIQSVLQRVIDAHVSEGVVSDVFLYYRDLETGASFGIKEDSQFTPASLMKVALMIALLKRADHEPGFLDLRLQYKGDDSTRFQDIKPQESLVPGARYTVDDLIGRMIAYSDNNAALLLVDRFGMKTLGRVLDELHIPVESSSVGELITLRNYSAFFRVLYNASYLDEPLSERALGYLSHSTFDEGIRAGLPGETLVASKFGEYSAGVYQLQEFGIVYYPEHPYLIGIVAKGGTRASHTHVMQELSRAIYDELNRQHGVHA